MERGTFHQTGCLSKSLSGVYYESHSSLDPIWSPNLVFPSKTGPNHAARMPWNCPTPQLGIVLTKAPGIYWVLAGDGERSQKMDAVDLEEDNGARDGGGFWEFTQKLSGGEVGSKPASSKALRLRTVCRYSKIGATLGLGRYTKPEPRCPKQSDDCNFNK